MCRSEEWTRAGHNAGGRGQKGWKDAGRRGDGPRPGEQQWEASGMREEQKRKSARGWRGWRHVWRQGEGRGTGRRDKGLGRHERLWRSEEKQLGGHEMPAHAAPWVDGWMGGRAGHGRQGKGERGKGKGERGKGKGEARGREAGTWGGRNTRVFHFTSRAEQAHLSGSAFPQHHHPPIRH
jgi:hypothetical protein